MATVAPVRDTTIPGGTRVVVSYTDMANGDTITPLSLGNAAGAVLAVQFTANAGGTTTAQVSIDKTNWETLRDVAGSDVSVAADETGYFECSTAAPWLRFSPGSGVTACTAKVSMVEASD
jgi:hypothetical protein